MNHRIKLARIAQPHAGGTPRLPVSLWVSAVVSAALACSPAVAATFTVINTSDAGAGSLRQAIEDANAATGPHTIEFAIPGIAADAPAIIRITSASLPPLVQPMIINGTTQPDSNTGSITGGQVLGVGPDFVPGSGDEATLPALPKPDVVIEYARVGSTNGIVNIDAPNVTLQGLGIRRGLTDAGGTATAANGVVLAIGANNTVLKQMWFGSSSGDNTNLVDGGVDHRLMNAVVNLSAGAWLFEQSVTVNTSQYGLTDQGSTLPLKGAVTARESYFGAAGLGVNWNAEPLNLGGVASGHLAERNFFSNPDYAAGLDLSGGSFATVRQNTFDGNFGVMNASDTDEAGAIIVRSGGSAHIEGNLIVGSGYASGVMVQGTGVLPASSGVVITRNSIYGNGQLGPAIGINLNAAGAVNADGVTPNDGALNNDAGNFGMDYPVLTSVTLGGPWMTVKGYVGTPTSGAAFGGAIIEFFAADDDVPASQDGEVIQGDGLSVPHGQGRVYLGALTAAADGQINGAFGISAAALAAWADFLGHAPGNGDPVTATATLAGPGTSEFGPNFVELELVDPPAATPVPTLSSGMLAGLGALVLLFAGVSTRGRRQRR